MIQVMNIKMDRGLKEFPTSPINHAGLLQENTLNSNQSAIKQVTLHPWDSLITDYISILQLL